MRCGVGLLVLIGWAAWAVESPTLPDWKKPYWPHGEAWRALPQTFTFNNETEPETLDPGLMSGVPESRLAEALFEGLATCDPMTLEPRPAVAERWDISSDRLTYTFHLRAEARWSDGAAVTADDFARSWRRVLTKATAAEYAYLLYPVRGAEDFHKGVLSDWTQVGIVATDARTLTVTLRAPCAYFLDLVAFHTFMPVPMAVVEQHGERWILPEHLIGNGPYRLQSWEPRRAIVMEPNPQYWDRAFVKLQRITALPYEDADTAWRVYQAGQLDWSPAVPLPQLERIRRTADYYAAPYFGTYFYRCNVTRPPLDDVRVRRALALAIDRRHITEQITRGGQAPTAVFCPAVAGYEPIAGLPEDIDRARALVLAWRSDHGGAPLPPIELLFNTSEAHRQIAEAVAEQWREALGITVILVNREWKTYLADLDRLNYHMARSSWIGDYADPSTFFDCFITGGGNNRTGWSHPRFDALARDAQSESDRAKRWAIFHEMEHILVEDDCPIIPVYTYVTQGVLRDDVRGFVRNVRDVHPFQYLWRATPP